MPKFFADPMLYPIHRAPPQDEYLEAAVNLLKDRKELNHIRTNRIFIRVHHYIPGDYLHNRRQAIESIQFEFATEEDRDLLVRYFYHIRAESNLIYVGYGLSTQPIIQISPLFFIPEPRYVPYI